MRYRLVSGLVLSCLWLLATLPNAWGGDEAHFQAMKLTKLSEAVALPDLQLPNLEGQSQSLQSFQNQVVLLNFWTTW